MKTINGFSENTQRVINNLRHKDSMLMFNTKEKTFVKIQLNPTSERICWQKYISKDKRNWIKWNECLSLKEVLDVRAEIAIVNQSMCFVE